MKRNGDGIFVMMLRYVMYVAFRSFSESCGQTTERILLGKQLRISEMDT